MFDLYMLFKIMSLVCYSGRGIVKAVKSHVVLLYIDEAHTCLKSQWGNQDMREEMSRAPAFLKTQFHSTTKAPVLAMTASAQTVRKKETMRNEIDEIADVCSIQHTKYTLITQTPVIHSQFIVRVSKPPACHGFDDEGGSADILWTIYLKHFVKCIKEGTHPKKAIMYAKNLDHLREVNVFLREKLGHMDIVKNPKTCQWVINSTCAGKVTIDKIRERSADPNGGIYFYATTSVMLLGLNIKDVPIVILFSPFTSLNSFVQAGGRAGRRNENGSRNKSVVYALYNNTDIRLNAPNLENNMREFYKTKDCLRMFTHSHFSESKCPEQNKDCCCSKCSLSSNCNK